MTVKERSENKTLRIELKDRRENGEDVMIKNGEIVRRKREINLGDYIVKTKMRNPRAQATSLSLNRSSKMNNNLVSPESFEENLKIGKNAQKYNKTRKSS